MPQAASKEYKCNGDLRVLEQGCWRCWGELKTCGLGNVNINRTWFFTSIAFQICKISAIKQTLNVPSDLITNWSYADNKSPELRDKEKAGGHHQAEELLQKGQDLKLRQCNGCYVHDSGEDLWLWLDNVITMNDVLWCKNSTWMW